MCHVLKPSVSAFSVSPYYWSAEGSMKCSKSLLAESWTDIWPVKTVQWLWILPSGAPADLILSINLVQKWLVTGNSTVVVLVSCCCWTRLFRANKSHSPVQRYFSIMGSFIKAKAAQGRTMTLNYLCNFVNFNAFDTRFMEPICDWFINCIYDNNKPIKSLEKADE